MNIIKRELKLGLKSFIFWTIGSFLLVVAGLIKFTGIADGGTSMSAIINQIPRVVQAMMGIVGINIETIGGYYAVLFYFVSLCAGIYGIILASNAVNRETIDKTYEFIYTKPRSRAFILSMKLLTGLFYLTLFMVFNIVFSFVGLQLLDIQQSMTKEILMFSCSTYLVSLFYFSLTALISSLVKRAEKGALLGNILFMATFIVGIVIDMLDKPGLLRVLSPLKYFPPSELLNGTMTTGYILFTIVGIVISLVATYNFFGKKDMNAVN